MRKLWILVVSCAVSSLALLAQNTSSPSSRRWSNPYTDQGSKSAAVAAPVEIFVGYSDLRASAEGVGFNMNGGSAEVGIPVYRRFSAVADLTGERRSRVNGGPQGLSLVSFSAGPRFTYPLHHRYAPFVQSLAGAVHGFDSYFPVASGAAGAASSLSLLVGGGLDIRMNSCLAIRPVQADYFLTQLPNGSDNRQSNFRLTAGIVLRLW